MSHRTFIESTAVTTAFWLDQYGGRFASIFRRCPPSMFWGQWVNWQKRRQAAKFIIMYLPYEIIYSICGCCKKLIKMVAYEALFASKVITSYSSNWITLLLLCTSAPLVLCCDRFDHGSRQVKRDPEDYTINNNDMLSYSLTTMMWFLTKRMIWFSSLYC